MTTLELDLGFAQVAARAQAPGAGEIAWTVVDGGAPIEGISGARLLEARVVNDRFEGPVDISVKLTARSVPARFEMAHGEWLYAAEGRVGKGVAAIGTHDAEWLAQNRLPAAMLAADVHDGIAALSISVAQAVVVTGVTFRFAIAWVDDWRGHPDLEVAPWLALSRALELPEISA